MSTKKILYATDYSESSRVALPLAVALAHQIGATLLIVHVSEHKQIQVGGLFQERREPDEEETRALNAVVPADTRVRCGHRLLFGGPGSSAAKVLVDFANQEKVELIVLGTRGRSGVSHLLLGSVAESVLRHASCPVITVRQPSPK